KNPGPAINHELDVSRSIPRKIYQVTHHALLRKAFVADFTEIPTGRKSPEANSGMSYRNIPEEDASVFVDGLGVCFVDEDFQIFGLIARAFGSQNASLHVGCFLKMRGDAHVLVGDREGHECPLFFFLRDLSIGVAFGLKCGEIGAGQETEYQEILSTGD